MAKRKVSSAGLENTVQRLEANQGELDDKIDGMIASMNEDSKNVAIAITKLTGLVESHDAWIKQNAQDIRSTNKRMDTFIIGGVAGVAGAVLIMIIRSVFNL